MTESLERTPQLQQDGQEEVKRDVHPEVQHCRILNVGSYVGQDNSHHCVAESVHEQHVERRAGESQQQPVAYALSYSGVLPGAAVLAGVGHEGRTQRGERHDSQAEYLTRRRVSRDNILAEAVYAVLEHNRADIHDGVHQRHAAARAKKLRSRGSRELEIPGLYHQERALLYQVDKAHDSGDKLRDDRSESRSGNSERKYHYHHDIQHDVEDRRNDQDNKRDNAVADCAEYRGFKVVKQRGDQPEADYHEIGPGFAENTRRGVQRMKKRVNKNRDTRDYERSRRRRKCDRAGDGTAHFVVVSGTEVLRNDYREAGNESVNNVEHQRHHRSGRADGGKRVLAELSADDYGIRKRVRLLERKSQKHRKRKADYQLYRFSRSKFFHSITCFMSV